MAAPDADVFATGRAVEAAWQGLGRTCDVLGVADEAMFEWQRRNPKPVMRKYQKASEIERDNWIRLVAEADDPIKVVAIILSPGADEEAAHQEHEEAMKAWQLRYEAAEHENERIAAEALQTAAGDELSEAVERLANTRATTIDGLRCKARLFRMMDE
jgi:hypothetical protein